MNRYFALYLQKQYAPLVLLSMAVFMCIPVSAEAQKTAMDQSTGKLVITGASTSTCWLRILM